MVELKNVNKTFAQHHILKNIHLRIKKGEIIAIVVQAVQAKAPCCAVLICLSDPKVAV